MTPLTGEDAVVALQIFWPKDGGYQEQNVAGAHYVMERWRRVILRVPPQPSGAVLRLDPCTRQGTVSLASVRVTPWGNKREGLRLRSREDFASLRTDQLVFVPDARCACMVSVGVDAKCFLPPVPPALVGRDLRVEVWVKFESSAEDALARLGALTRKFEDQELAEQRLEWLESNLRSQREMTAQLEQKLQAKGLLEEALQQTKEALEEQKTTLRFLTAELGHVRSELDWTRNEMDRLRKENDRRKIALRTAEQTFQFRWTLPAFLLRKRQGKAAAEAGGFEFHLESPKSFNLIGDSATLVGWCFAKSGEYIQAIRATVGEAKFDGAYGRKRFDVRSVFPNFSNSDRCGFEIEVKDLPARFSLAIEALDDHGVWHALKTIEGKVATSIWGLDRAPRGANGSQPPHEQIMKLTAKEIRLLGREIRDMNHQPLVSVLMPVFNTPADYLRQAIQSVTAQIYPHWQLCIANDASTNPATLEVLREFEGTDPRIVVYHCPGNGGIAAASNAALGLAKGDVIALMDHDDLISPVALLRVAQAFIGQGADFIYSDEGHITPGGEYLGGIYRPAFSWSYLRSHPYIVHLVAFSARLLRDIGGFQERLTISQDYDLILRAAEKAKSIVHIPEILYLWRQLPSSAGHVHQEKVMETSASILRAHLKRSGFESDVEPGFAFNFFKTRPRVDVANTSLAVIIPTKNQAPLLRRCVESLEATLPEKLRARIVIVDHASEEEETRELLSELGQRHTILPYSGVFNYSAINNFAVRRGAGDAEFLLMCNNDIEAAAPAWFETLLEAAAEEKVGVVAPLLLYPDKVTVQHAGVSVGLCGPAEHLGKFLASADDAGRPVPGYQGMLRVTREVSAITTACALFRRRAFEAVGGFSEEMQVGFNDTDLCLRLWQHDYRVLYCGETQVIHHESATRGKSFANDPHPADSRRFMENWGWLITRGDPFYNPNFRPDSTSWETVFGVNRSARSKSRCYTGPSSMFLK